MWVQAHQTEKPVVMKNKQQLYGIFDIDTNELVSPEEWDGEEDSTIFMGPLTGFNRAELEKIILSQRQSGFWEVRAIY